MRVILIDDEPWAIDALKNQLKKIPDVEIVKTFTNPLEAYQELEEHNVDIVFLDIKMGNVHGLEFAEQLLSVIPHLQIIFVTAFDQYALEAFEVNAIDYLLKPVTFSRLIKTFSRLQKYTRSNFQHENKLIHTKLSAHMLGGFQLFDHNGNHVKWRTKKVKELFIYLWQHKDMFVHKMKIIDNLWPDTPIEKSLALLHTSVYQLRTTLKGLGEPNPIPYLNDQYKLDCEIDSDIQILENYFKFDIESLSEKSLDVVLELYKGNYLDEDNYHWAISKQQSIKFHYLHFLEQFIKVNFTSLRQSSSVIRCLEKLLEIEPYDEKYFSYLITYLGQSKDKKELLSAFQYYKEKWSEDLGLDLPKEIYDLYHQYVVQ